MANNESKKPLYTVVTNEARNMNSNPIPIKELTFDVALETNDYYEAKKVYKGITKNYKKLDVDLNLSNPTTGKKYVIKRRLSDYKPFLNFSDSTTF